MIGNKDQNPGNEEELFQVRGRELPPEELIMKCRGTGVLKTLQGSKEGDWDRTIKDWHMIETGSLENWGFVCTRRDQKRGSQFFSHLKDQGSKIGFRIEAPLVHVAETDRKDDINNAIASIFQNHYHNGVNTEMIFVLLPSRKADVYANVKLACMRRDRPVMSQCLLTSTIMADDKIAAVAFKVAMQMSCKLGGVPWQVKINLKNTMIIGIDTYHDTDRKGKNLTGFVSSYNKNATKWYSQTVQMCSKQEISDGLTHMMEGALEAWRYYNNNQLPDRIIIYRDGVGDGQLSYIHDHELPQIQTKINEYIGHGYDHEPQLLYIVLKKQINQRFFRMNENGEEDNPYPGTVVDSKITRRDMYDFLLVSQKVRQGTVTPVHYNVIYDSTLNLNADKIQMISYKLTHLYFNWPGTIRVPAPCQYAHKLATLIGDHIHTEITDVEFASKPFYL